VSRRANAGTCGHKWAEFGKHKNVGSFSLWFPGGEEITDLVKLAFILQNDNNKKNPLKRNFYPAVNLTNLSLRPISINLLSFVYFFSRILFHAKARQSMKTLKTVLSFPL
jgi:hypothetical protein